MVYAVQAFLKFGSSSARDQVLNEAETFTASNEKWGAERIDPITWEGDPALIIELRLEAKANQTALTNRLDQYLSGPLTPLTGSYVRWHDCPHDENRGACPVGSEQTW